MSLPHCCDTGAFRNCTRASDRPYMRNFDEHVDQGEFFQDCISGLGLLFHVLADVGGFKDALVGQGYLIGDNCAPGSTGVLEGVLIVK